MVSWLFIYYPSNNQSATTITKKTDINKGILDTHATHINAPTLNLYYQIHVGLCRLIDFCLNYKSVIKKESLISDQNTLGASGITRRQHSCECRK